MRNDRRAGSIEAPYSRLTPECMLDGLEAVGLRCDGRFLALNSYENRVYQMGLEDGGFVVAKFYRPGRWSAAQILEEHDFVGELAQEEIPVVAPMLLACDRTSAAEAGPSTLAEHDGYLFAVYPRRGGRAPELENPDVLQWLGRFIGRIHAVGARRAFEHRPALNLQTFGIEPREWLRGSDVIVPELRTAWTEAVDTVLDAVRRTFDATGPLQNIRLHGDCHLANVLWTDGGPHFVDFDDARSGPAVQDLWMLVSGDRAAMGRQWSELLDGYRDFADFDLRELRLVEALRSLRLIHYSAWIARRWADPAFPAAFPWFGTRTYWEQRVRELHDQLEAMQQAPPEVY